jgi:hypothetical protein
MEYPAWLSVNYNLGGLRDSVLDKEIAHEVIAEVDHEETVELVEAVQLDTYPDLANEAS